MAARASARGPARRETNGRVGDPGLNNACEEGWNPAATAPSTGPARGSCTTDGLIPIRSSSDIAPVLESVERLVQPYPRSNDRAKGRL
jgi:hypothetical protein